MFCAGHFEFEIQIQIHVSVEARVLLPSVTITVKFEANCGMSNCTHGVRAAVVAAIPKWTVDMADMTSHETAFTAHTN